MFNVNDKKVMTKLESVIVAVRNESNDVAVLAKKSLEWIENEIVNTGKTFRIDLFQLCERNVIALDEVSLFEKELNTAIFISDKLTVEKESNYVLKLQCKEKIKRILGLSKLQKLVYELYYANPAVAKLGLNKMSEEERMEMDLVLTYDR